MPLAISESVLGSVFSTRATFVLLTVMVCERIKRDELASLPRYGVAIRSLVSIRSMLISFGVKPCCCKNVLISSAWAESCCWAGISSLPVVTNFNFQMARSALTFISANPLTLTLLLFVLA